MAEDKKGPGFSGDESIIMHGLVSRIIETAAKGEPDTTILDIALRMKAEALNKLDPNKKTNAKFLEAYDKIIGFIKENPDKSVLDFFKENPS